MGSRKISTQCDLLHAEKALKGRVESRSDNETIKNKILRRKMFWILQRESLACNVSLFNTFPPEITAVQAISKQLHGNCKLCQNLRCNSCCTSRGHGRPLGLDPPEAWHLNGTLANWRATSDDAICEVGSDDGCWFVTWGLNSRRSTARGGTLYQPAKFNLESWSVWGRATDFRHDVHSPKKEDSALT